MRVPQDELDGDAANPVAADLLSRYTEKQLIPAEVQAAYCDELHPPFVMCTGFRADTNGVGATPNQLSTILYTAIYRCNATQCHSKCRMARVDDSVYFVPKCACESAEGGDAAVPGITSKMVMEFFALELHKTQPNGGEGSITILPLHTFSTFAGTQFQSDGEMQVVKYPN